MIKLHRKVNDACQNHYSGPMSNTNREKKKLGTYSINFLFAVTAHFKTSHVFLTLPAFSLKQTCQRGLLWQVSHMEFFFLRNWNAEHQNPNHKEKAQWRQTGADTQNIQGFE